MKKLLMLFFIVLFAIPVFADDVPTDQDNLFFSAENVKGAIVDFVPEKNQEKVANLYEELMNQENGKMSIEKLFLICRAAGFNTYRVDGYNKCAEFIGQMLNDVDADYELAMGMFCPGPDENGKNPNGLQSITDQTQIGEFCISSNIAAGEVIFRKDNKTCTCLATACNPGFGFNNGRETRSGTCMKIIGPKPTTRKEFKKDSKTDTLEKCKNFCISDAQANDYNVIKIQLNHKDNKCICNPNTIDDERGEELRAAALKSFKVCGVDKGRTGGKEICVLDIFNNTNVGQLQAAGLAREYARIKYNDTIQCETQYRESGNDDYIRCHSTKKGVKNYYEFKFDDVTESIDGQIKADTVAGICALHNLGEYSGIGCIVKNNEKLCTGKLAQSAKEFGMSVKFSGHTCDILDRQLARETADKELATLKNIDPRIFYDGIQIQGSANIVSQLRTYVQKMGYPAKKFTCDSGVGKIKRGTTSLMEYVTGNTDDVLRCYVDDMPVDFVFDDFSESWLYVREAGESGIGCIGVGGKYANEKCYGLNQQQCTDLDRGLKVKHPDMGGTKWEGGQCVLRDAKQAAKYDIAIQVGGALVAAADCLLLTKTGCAILAVEYSGLMMELNTQDIMKDMADKFLTQSTKCNSRDCAKQTISTLGGQVLSVQEALKPETIRAIDEEFARLITLLDDSDVSLSSDSDYEDIVKQLGGDPNDSNGTTLKVLNKIGLVAQFTSIGISGFRLTSGAIQKLISRSAAKSGTKTAAAASKVKVFNSAGKEVAKNSMPRPLNQKNIDELDKINQQLKTATGQVKTKLNLQKNTLLNAIRKQMIGDGVPDDEITAALARFYDNPPPASAADNATRAVDDVVDNTPPAPKSEPTPVVKPVDNTPPAPKPTPVPISETTTLRTQASNTFDNYLFNFKKNNTTASFPKSRMTDTEWAKLNSELTDDGVKLVQKGDYMTFVKTADDAPVVKPRG
ncbi:MAG: hypothetical protein LBL75_01365 [Rickettsiales bacterium]|nr:hypothetical protein [Rickettsiales bacterium]